MYEFWYDYVKTKYGEKAKLCKIDTDSFIFYIKVEHMYVGTAKDVQTRYDASNYKLDTPFLKGKIKK